jgi:hypothetical protein
MEMRQAVEAYCRVIESARSTDRDHFVTEVAATLSAVLATAYRLPDDAVGDIDDDGITHEHWYAQMKDVQGVLDGWDNYWTTFAPYNLDPETGLPDPTIGTFEEKVANLSLADALADIWRDVRNGLDYLNRGGDEEEAVGIWGFSFRFHWGARAVEALRAIHQQVTN